MPARFSIEDRALCAFWYHESNSIVTVQRRFRKIKKHASTPDRNSILLWHKSLFTCGTVLDKKREKCHSVVTDDLSNSVIGAVLANPKTSLRRLSTLFTISLSSIHRILHNFSFHPYKLQTVQQLNANDLVLRLKFCQDEIVRISCDPLHLVNLLHTDEANFHLSGAVNKQNFRYWSSQNPNWVTDEPLHSPKVIVWAGVSSKRIIGPFFFDENVNGTNYLLMLQEKMWPELTRREKESIRFMQDGAPPHWSHNVREWLNEHFPNRWIGRGSPNMPWPPRSPDLTMCDFFLWGHIKSLVYREKFDNVDQLKAAIIQAFASVNSSMRERVVVEYQRRLQKCIEKNGSYVEVDMLTSF
jgi:hypothetical protein